MLWNDVPLSIQHAYAVIIKDANALNKYRTYRSLKLIGYKLHKIKKQDKRELEEKTESQSKRVCSETFPEGTVDDDNRITADAPIQIQNTDTVTCDYKIRLPESTKKDDDGFYLYIKYKVHIVTFCPLLLLFFF